MIWLEVSKTEVPFLENYYTSVQGFRMHPGDIVYEAEL